PGAPGGRTRPRGLPRRALRRAVVARRRRTLRVVDTGLRVGVLHADLALEAIRVTEADAEDRTEVRHEAVAGAAGDEPVADGLERVERIGVQRQVVDAATPEHRRLVLRFVVALDLEHVELGMRPHVHDRQPHTGGPGRSLRTITRHRRIEHGLVERVQPLRVLGEDRHLVEPVEQHAVRLCGAYRAGGQLFGWLLLERSASVTCVWAVLPPRVYAIVT